MDAQASSHAPSAADPGAGQLPRAMHAQEQFLYVDMPPREKIGDTVEFKDLDTYSPSVVLERDQHGAVKAAGTYEDVLGTLMLFQVVRAPNGRIDDLYLVGTTDKQLTISEPVQP